MLLVPGAKAKTTVQGEDNIMAEDVTARATATLELVSFMVGRSSSGWKGSDQSLRLSSTRFRDRDPRRVASRLRPLDEW